MTTTTVFPTWPVDGPPPLAPPFGLLQAAESPAAGVRMIVDTAIGPVPENTIAPTDAGLEEGLYRNAAGEIIQRAADGSETIVYVPDNAGRERWLNGVAVWPYPTDVPEGWAACGSSGQTTKGFGDQSVTPPEFEALTITEAITCTAQSVMTGGKPDEAKFRARAVAVLGAVQGWRVERELMNGEVFPGRPFLSDGSGTFPNGDAATKPNHALQVLEEAIAATGRLGLIHCSPMLATALMGAGFALSDKTGVIRTINGNVVIPGFGYADAAAPNSHAAPGATEEWAYATGPVDIRRSEIFTQPDNLAEALDRGLGATNDRTNQVTYRAERYYVTVWDTALQAAVLVDRCSTTCAVSS